MKQKPDLSEIQELMAPGKLTARGFLGDDTRSLADILAADNLLVRKLGVDHSTIAEKMLYLMNEGRKGLGNPVRVQGHFIVTVDENRGVVACPFRHGHLSEKINVSVENLELDERLLYSDLSIHLIVAHGFYQGKGSFFRLDPEELVRILEIVSF